MMETHLLPTQMTGSARIPAQDFYAKKLSVQINQSIFGGDYFNLKAPARTFRTRNVSLTNNLPNPRKESLELVRNRHSPNGYNYATRKFHLISDKIVDRVLPSKPSAANLLINLKEADLQASPSRNAFHRQRNSVPPPNSDLGLLPALDQCKIAKAADESVTEMERAQIKSIPLANRRIRQRSDSAQARTPSYMHDERSENEGSLPPESPLETRVQSLQLESDGFESDLMTIPELKRAVKICNFEISAKHKGPKELLHEKLVAKAKERQGSILRSKGDLDKLMELSKLQLQFATQNPESPLHLPHEGNPLSPFYSHKRRRSKMALPKPVVQSEKKQLTVTPSFIQFPDDGVSLQMQS